VPKFEVDNCIHIIYHRPVYVTFASKSPIRRSLGHASVLATLRFLSRIERQVLRPGLILVDLRRKVSKLLPRGRDCVVAEGQPQRGRVERCEPVYRLVPLVWVFEKRIFRGNDRAADYEAAQGWIRVRVVNRYVYVFARDVSAEWSGLNHGDLADGQRHSIGDWRAVKHLDIPLRIELLRQRFGKTFYG
jgi:hypothetical protein